MHGSRTGIWTLLFPVPNLVRPMFPGNPKSRSISVSAWLPILFTQGTGPLHYLVLMDLRVLAGRSCGSCYVGGGGPHCLRLIACHTMMTQAAEHVSHMIDAYRTDLNMTR